MYPYLVLVDRTFSARVRDTVVTDEGQEIRPLVPIEDEQVTIRAFHTTGFWTSVSHLYCRTENEAKLLAPLLAKRNPGARVLITKVDVQVVCPPGEPVVSSVSEKGVLPR